MPLYEFLCVKCGRHFDELVAWSQKQGVRCPHCGGETQEVMVGFAVKGGGGGGKSSGSCTSFG